MLLLWCWLARWDPVYFCYLLWGAQNKKKRSNKTPVLQARSRVSQIKRKLQKLVPVSKERRRNYWPTFRFSRDNVLNLFHWIAASVILAGQEVWLVRPYSCISNYTEIAGPRSRLERNKMELVVYFWRVPRTMSGKLLSNNRFRDSSGTGSLSRVIGVVSQITQKLQELVPV